MKLLQIALGQAIRFVPISGLQGRLYGPNLARPFERRYGFLQGPLTVEQWDISKGIAFLHGVFEGTVIEKFTLFTDGVVCETKVDTLIAERFIDDALKWAREEGGFAIPGEPVSRGYISRVNVQMDVDLDRAIPGLTEFGTEIARTVTAYGRNLAHQYGVAGLHFHLDPSNPAAPLPFLFERTINQPYSSRQYFSSAPVTTADHLRLLEKLETTLAHL
jgi:hypothetical protein